jgi:lipoprotein-releasing system permease protein
MSKSLPTGSLSLLLSMSMRLISHAPNKFARFVTWVSLVGLTLGVTVLTLVVTVMNGFDYELRDRLLGSIPHITLGGNDYSAQVLQDIEQDERVVYVSRFYRGIGAIAQQGRVRPISLIGVDPTDASALGSLERAMVLGSIADLSSVDSGVVMGQPLAGYFGLDVGDSLLVAVTKPQGDSAVLVTMRLNLVGTFELGADPDYSMLLVNLAEKNAQEWRSLGKLGIRIELTDPMFATDVAAELIAQNSELQLVTWTEDFGELFQAVQLEKTMMFVLLLLVVAIAGFNIVAGQFMMVSDKRSDIAILRTIGATQRFILSLFLLQGSVISFFGTLAGLGLGLALAANIDLVVDALAFFSGKHLLDGSYFVTVPTRILYWDLVLIAVISGALALWSAWLPARSASQLDPAQNLH